MELPADVLAIRSDEGNRYRTQPIVFSLALSRMISQDGFEVSITLQQTVRVVDTPADKVMLDEQFLNGNDKLSLDLLQTKLRPYLSQSIEELISRYPAADFFDQQKQLDHISLELLNDFGFSCGLEFLAPIRVTISCPALALQRESERIEKDRAQQLVKASLLSNQMKDLGSAHLFRSDEQASLLQILLRTQPTRPIYLAVGSKLVQFDPSTMVAQPIDLNPSIGPLRSIRHSQLDGLSIGGQLGVLTRSSDGVLFSYLLNQSSGDYGINSSHYELTSRRLYGTHSKMGLVIWNTMTHPAEIIATIPSEIPLRNLINHGGIFMTAGNRILMLDETEQKLVTFLEVPSPIVRLIPASNNTYWIIQEDGQIDRMDWTAQDKKLHSFTRSTKILDARLIEIEGLSALMISPSNGPIQIVSSAGQPLLELLGNHHGIRMLEWSGRWFFGVSSDRQQLIVWDSTSPQSPCHQLHVAGRFGNRIADIC